VQSKTAEVATTVAFPIADECRLEAGYSLISLILWGAEIVM
jgi:hypothetical protein